MDYDSIAKGRRRGWDELKPEDIRRQELEAEKERRKQEKLKEPRKLTYQEYRQLLKEQEEQRDQKLFIRARRQVILLVSVFLFALVGWLIVEGALDTRARAAQQNKLAIYQQDIRRGVRVYDVSDPTSAFATWRSAWMRQDFRLVTDLYSDTYTARASGGNRTRRETLAVELRHAFERGNLSTQLRVVNGFEDPELVRIPRAPWADRELAIFRTSRPVVTTPLNPAGDHYIVAMSWDQRTNQWRFADMRKAEFFSVRWLYESAIRADMAEGPNAVRYDAQGRIISPEPR